MFNKAILAAALLSVGAITAGTAASAAEIGVRNTTGYTTRDITHGSSSYVREVTGTYSEDSAGFALGITADDFEVSTYNNGGSFSDTYGVTEGTFEGTASGAVELPGDGEDYNWAVGGSAPTELALDGTFEGTSQEWSLAETWSNDGLEVDGQLRVSGSGYVRHESGSISETAEESYRFSGSSYNSFSELSTFSR